MPTTPNYGWDTPADTDYVTNGALSIRTLGNDADATVYALDQDVTALDAAVVKKTGSVMTGSLATPSLALIQDGSNNTTLFVTDPTNTTVRGSIAFSNNTDMAITLASNTSRLDMNNFGDTNRTTSGETRPFAFAVEAGYEIGIPANSSVTVSLSSGRFTEIPIVFVTANSTSGSVRTCHVGGISTSSFTIYNTTASASNVFWQAIQMLSNSAAG
jgi:hypothetical protein